MRLCRKGWLNTYLEYTEKTESPEIFHIWSGISAIAGAMGRNCFVNRGFFINYPNQYIILVSGSALCKKSTAAEIALGIYNEAVPKYPAFARKPSMQKLIQNLDGIRKKLGYSFCFLYNDELSTLFGRGAANTDLMDFITAQYMCLKSWLYETISRDEEWVKDCYLNFLGCTTPNDLAEMPGSLVGGGLAGRIIFIHSETPKSAISDPMEFYTPEIIKLRGDLVQDLKEISKIQREYKLTRGANKLHKKLYEENFNKSDFDFRLQPYQGRKGEHLISIAMILCASRGDDTLIDEHDIAAANHFLLGMEETVLDAFVGLGHENETKHIDHVLKILRKHGGSISHSKLLKLMYRYTNANALGEIINTLMEANVIKLDVSKGGRVYAIIEEGEI